MNLLDEMKARQIEMEEYAEAIKECYRKLAHLPPTHWKVLPVKLERRLANILLAGFEAADLKESFGDIFEDDAKLHDVADGAAIAVVRGYMYIASIHDGKCTGVIAFPYSQATNVISGVVVTVERFEVEQAAQAEDACDQCEPAAAI